MRVYFPIALAAYDPQHLHYSEVHLCSGSVVRISAFHTYHCWRLYSFVGIFSWCGKSCHLLCASGTFSWCGKSCHLLCASGCACSGHVQHWGQMSLDLCMPVKWVMWTCKSCSPCCNDPGWLGTETKLPTHRSCTQRCCSSLVIYSVLCCSIKDVCYIESPQQTQQGSSPAYYPSLTLSKDSEKIPILVI